MTRALLLAILLHGLEDAALISVGRFLPVSTVFRYLLGMGLSALILWFVLRQQRAAEYKSALKLVSKNPVQIGEGVIQ